MLPMPGPGVTKHSHAGSRYGAAYAVRQDTDNMHVPTTREKRHTRSRSNTRLTAFTPALHPGNHRCKIKLDPDPGLHPGNLPFLDPPDMSSPCLWARPTSRPIEGGVAHDSGMEAPFPGRWIHQLATPVRHRRGVSGEEGDPSARATRRPIWTSHMAAPGGNRGARGGLTEDLMHWAAVGRPKLHLHGR